MKASELRIGNYVFDKFRNREVLVWGIESNHDRIVVNYANGSGIYTVDLKDIEPIPLTEEWLLKFGFIFSKIQQRYLLKVDSELWICWNQEEEYNLQNVNEILVKFKYIKYVHQIQNLYFALTGEELQLK